MAHMIPCSFPTKALHIAQIFDIMKYKNVNFKIFPKGERNMKVFTFWARSLDNQAIKNF